MATGVAEGKVEKVMPGRGKSTPRKVKRMEIEHADGGGHIVTHHFHGADEYSELGERRKPETHVFAHHEGPELMMHVAKHMKVKPPAEESEGADKEDELYGEE